MRLYLAPHLSRLKDSLRMIGLDTDIWHKGPSGRTAEDRVVQWDRYPLPVRGVSVITLTAPDEPGQLRELLATLDFRPSAATGLLGRCLRCNLPLEPLSAESLGAYRGQIPVYILQTQRRFNRCPGCGRIYWPGTHARNMLARLKAWGLV